ncbi:Limonene 1,2-monooxygenase [Gordonia paraffinivorans]|uniref:Limonene 1,2-monooxygenase n=1 Tax=Gordonia paraffinivorans TaxID=175628 RepID=A0ABD7UY48_9ACTN|nr:LLM class flavin-dependent oxidoreductase [Gordonia paraffinivorans]VFA81408.1 Limonene 1,2-monooxygenase [Gordonia paraffinivorans]
MSDNALLRPNRFGIFLPPYNIAGISPNVLLKQAMDLVVHADEFGLDEAWIGEHHSGGAEIIGSPEVMLAALSQVTSNIRLGTGVNSLSYHHPFNLAERLMLVDQLSKGRAMMGFGPGQLVSDAYMMGVDTNRQREMMAESAEAIVRLINGEIVTMETDWFKLDEARLQVLPYNRRKPFDMVVASVASPSGPRTAGRLGTGMLTMSVAGAGDSLRSAWSVAETEAEYAGTTISRENWRLSNFMHLADTEEQARKDFEYGFAEMWDYLGQISVIPKADTDDLNEKIDAALETGIIFLGTPDSAIEYIESLVEETGGFGCFLMNTNDFASPAAQLRSIELMAERVAPHFRGQFDGVDASRDWTLAKRNETGETIWKDQAVNAIELATKQYEEEVARREQAAS